MSSSKLDVGGAQRFFQFDALGRGQRLLVFDGITQGQCAL